MDTSPIPNWQDPKLIQNPFPYYKILQEKNPFIFDTTRGVWIVSSYEDSQRILKDSRFSTDRFGIFLDQYPAEEKAELEPLFTLARRWIIFREGPQHDSIRTPLVRSIAMQTQRSFNRIIQEEVDQIFQTFPATGELDLLRRIASPFPMAIICRIMGLSIEDSSQIKAWADDLTQFIDVSTDIKVARAAKVSLQNFMNYLRPIWAEKKAQESSDLLGVMFKNLSEHSSFVEDDILANIILIFIAGHETTTSLIANAISLLWQNPDQLALIKNDPQLLPAAIEEVLRFDAPIQRIGRTVTEDILWNKGQQLKKGEYLSIIIGAANRDENEFADAQSFDILRAKNRHLAFGGGAHFCVGAQLARMEAAAVITRLLKDYPNMKLLEPESSYFPNLTFRCRSAVRVSLA